MPDTPKDLVPTRRSLLTRLKRWDDQEGWQLFFNTYWKLLYGFASKAGLADEDAQDVVQETIISVARQMPQFRYNSAAGSFRNWLFLITRRRIADHLRRKYRQVKTVQPAPGATTHTALLERQPQPGIAALDSLWEDEWKRHVFAAAVRRVKNQVEASHFQVFDCYVLKEWPVRDVARAFGIKPGQVYVLKHRISALLEKELKRLDLTGL